LPICKAELRGPLVALLLLPPRLDFQLTMPYLFPPQNLIYFVILNNTKQVMNKIT
jgi:hypothetical protein